MFSELFPQKGYIKVDNETVKSLQSSLEKITPNADGGQLGKLEGRPCLVATIEKNGFVSFATEKGTLKQLAHTAEILNQVFGKEVVDKLGINYKDQTQAMAHISAQKTIFETERQSSCIYRIWDSLFGPPESIQRLDIILTLMNATIESNKPVPVAERIKTLAEQVKTKKEELRDLTILLKQKENDKATLVSQKQQSNDDRERFSIGQKITLCEFIIGDTENSIKQFEAELAEITAELAKLEKVAQ